MCEQVHTIREIVECRVWLLKGVGILPNMLGYNVCKVEMTMEILGFFVVTALLGYALHIRRGASHAMRRQWVRTTPPPQRIRRL